MNKGMVVWERALLVAALAALLAGIVIMNTEFYDDGSFRTVFGIGGCYTEGCRQVDVPYVNYNVPPDDDIITFEDGSWLAPLPGGGMLSGCTPGELCGRSVCINSLWEMLEVHEEDGFESIIMIQGKDVSVFADGDLIATGTLEGCYE